MTAKSEYTLLDTLKQNHKSSFVRVLRNSDQQKFILKIPEIRNDRNLKAEFQQEFDVIHKLKSESILNCLTLENYLGQQILVFENCNGVFLSDFLATKDIFSPELFLKLAVNITEALAEIHHYKIIHKDIRPDNIIIDPLTEKVKFTGFGYSTTLLREVPTIETNKLSEGSLPYVSPEQTGLLKRSVDNRSDLYSLGITFFQMLTKKFPFEAHDPLEWIHCHIARHPASVLNFNKNVPEMIIKIVMKLLAKMSDDRYQTASGLCHDLALCLKSWNNEKTIPHFQLGQNDVSGKFIIPSKIYGREKEKASLINQFREFSKSGQIQLCLISGYSGIGKSSLVRELYAPVIESGGQVISGKFDQHKKNIPYATLVQAFHELINTILIDTEDKINEWKIKLLNVLGSNGQLIIEVIPQIELLIGKQPAIQELPPMEAQNRFRKVFHSFISVFANKEHPLVLFLDDLQWADTGSLELIRDLLINVESHFIFIVGAYRDNEVNNLHPLIIIVNELKKLKININEITLGQLSQDHLTSFIADALHCSLSDALPLVHLLYDKTAGNPFFVIQFMSSLYEEELISYDIENKKWIWNLEKIFQKGISENVIDLIIKKIKRLPSVTQWQLEQLSCFGESAEIDVLKTVLGQEENQLQENFREAINNGIIVCAGGKYKFLHDRIQEAAYTLLSTEEQKSSHLKIARNLNSNFTDNKRQIRIFEITDQFNHALDLLDEAELKNVMNLNLQAAVKAKKSTAFKTAVFYAECGIKCFSNLKQSVDKDETAFQLHYLKIQSEAALGNFKLAQMELTPLLNSVSGRRQKAMLLQIQVEIFTSEGKSQEALEIALECLKLYNLMIPIHPGIELVDELTLQVETQIQNIGLNDITKIPRTNNQEIEVVMGLMTAILPNAYFFNNNLHRMVSAQMIRLTLNEGVCAQSAMGFAAYGLDCCGLEKYREAKQYGDIAYALMDKHKFESIKAKVCNIVGATIIPWTDNLEVGIEYLRQGTLAEGGDAIFASLCKLYILILSFEAGTPLEKIESLAVETINYINAQGFAPLSISVNLLQRFILVMQGKTNGPNSFADKNLDEQKWVEEIQKNSLPLMMTWYHIYKLQAAVYFNETEFALNQIIKGEEVLPLLKGQQAEVGFAFFSALAIIEAWPQEMPKEWKRRLDLFEKRLKNWASINEFNFRCRHFLVQAEIARINGRNWEAASFYQQSINSSKTFGFIHLEALAYEKAARFYQKQGFEVFADKYYQEAYSAYKAWGANGKLDHLETICPSLKNKKSSVHSTFSVQPIDFDFYSTIKASQAISGKIDFDKLITELLNIALEQSGAQKGTLLLCRQKNIYIEAEAYVQNNEITSELHEPISLENADNLPLTIIRYVQRSKEKIIYNDFDKNQTLFSSDIYIKKHGPKSILCLPILRNNELEGILYLENNLLSGVFSLERLAVLELIASQSAISLQNAQLFKSLKEEIVQRENVEGALRVNQEQLQSIIDSTSALIYIKQPDGKYLLVNRQFELLFKQKRFEIIGKTDFDFIHHEEAEVLRNNDLIALRSGIIEKEEVITIFSEKKTYLSIKFPLFSADGTITSVCGISTDITDRKKIETEKEEMILQKQTALIEAEKSIAARDNFIAIASHELRTPITPLKIYIDILKEQLRDVSPDSHPQFYSIAKAVNNSDQSLRRLTRLTEDLLDVSRIQSGQYVLEKRQFDLVALVKDVINRFVSEKKIDLELFHLFSHGEIIGYWDYSKLEQLVENLLSNAVKYGLGKKVDISITRETDKAILSVQDYGIGIEEKEQLAIFERFGRAASIRNFEGLGLGLYLVKEIVSAHKGNIKVVSKLDVGSKFIVELPLNQ